MSLLHKADIYPGSTEIADRRPDYRFVLALICMALALGVAGAVFTPVNIGSGISNEVSLVGP